MMKVLLLTHYLFIDFSCGIIEGIQSLLIGVFIYVINDHQCICHSFSIYMSVKNRSFKQEDWEMVAKIVSANKQVNENWHAMQTIVLN